MRRIAVATFMACAVLISAAARPQSGSTIVAPDGDLQGALNAARPGDTILLTPGATYVGHFILPTRLGSDTQMIVLRTAGADAVPTGTRMAPDRAPTLAKLRSPDSTPALRTSPGARYWRIELVEFLANRNGVGDIIALGDGSSAQSSLRDVASDLVLDRVYIHGDPQLGQKRGIALNSRKTVITNSYIADIKATGIDSQAICGWNGPGDYLIQNNYLEAAGENIMFGGADPSILGLTPTNILITGNTLSKPLEWRTPRAGERGWQVKNLFELKNARDVVVERNVLERNWSAAQSGYAVLFTVRNQDGGCPWCQVENIRFSRNIVRDVAAGVQILGTDTGFQSRHTNRIEIRENLFDRIDRERWGGDGYFLQITGGPRGVTVDHNTVIQGASNGIAKIEEVVYDFVFTNNLVSHGSYGIIATNRGVGNDTIRSSLPGALISGNVIAGGNRSLYPPGNLFPTVDDFRRQFVDFDGRNYRLKPGSDWIRTARAGNSLGADLLRLPAGK